MVRDLYGSQLWFRGKGKLNGYGQCDGYGYD